MGLNAPRSADGGDALGEPGEILVDVTVAPQMTVHPPLVHAAFQRHRLDSRTLCQQIQSTFDVRRLRILFIADWHDAGLPSLCQLYGLQLFILFSHSSTAAT